MTAVKTLTKEKPLFAPLPVSVNAIKFAPTCVTTSTLEMNAKKIAVSNSPLLLYCKKRLLQRPLKRLLKNQHPPRNNPKKLPKLQRRPLKQKRLPKKWLKLQKMNQRKLLRGKRNLRLMKPVKNKRLLLKVRKKTTMKKTTMKKITMKKKKMLSIPRKTLNMTMNMRLKKKPLPLKMLKRPTLMQLNKSKILNKPGPLLKALKLKSPPLITLMLLPMILEMSSMISMLLS